ncbi:MAG: hypothetical protein J5I50_02385 [Chitinophagaceae bacterium]|nr:hypothetical protein [Chitinophagaceae bacterium]
MKVDKKIAEFIELRIAGNSFDEIAKILSVAKSTLIEWNKKAEVKGAIQEGKAIAINTIVKAFQYDRQARLKALLALSKRINDELKSRDLKDVSTDKLLQMSVANDGRLQKLLDQRIQIGENPSIITFDSGDGYFEMYLDE